MTQHTLEALREFHEAMGLDAPRSFTYPPEDAKSRSSKAILSETLFGMADKLKDLGRIHDDDVILLRFRLIIEELGEVCEALLDGDPDKILWELTDLRYVVEGLVVTLGLDQPAGEAFRRIHAANMSKLDDDGNPVREPGGKIIKGPNYRKADLAGLAMMRG